VSKIWMAVRCITHYESTQACMRLLLLRYSELDYFFFQMQFSVTQFSCFLPKRKVDWKAMGSVPNYVITFFQLI
jgi:hypothetical protein